MTDSVSEGMVVSSCATAARDENLNGGADQHTGALSPPVYDNPGCDEGYVVEFDGTVNGGQHVGYKLAEPTSSDPHDGIQVFFAAPPPNPVGACVAGMMIGLAHLYEKVNGTWVFRGSVYSAAMTPVYNLGNLVDCRLDPVYFGDVHHGTISQPRIYRVAASLDILMPEKFKTPGAYPDGAGYGLVSIRACDAANPCP